MRIYNNKKGFSLLEIIFALAILVIGIVGVLALFPVGLKASKRSGDFTMATVLAQRQMETMKRARDIYTNNWAPTGNPQLWGYPNSKEFVGNPGYSWKAIVSELGITNLRQVTLSIYWLDGGSQRSEDFVTYLAKY